MAIRSCALLLIFTVGCASTNVGKALNVGVIAAGTADVVSTRSAMARGAVERNPLMSQRLAQQIVVKGLGIGVVLALTQLLEVTHRSPRLAHVLRGIAITAWSLAAWHNERIGR